MNVIRHKNKIYLIVIFLTVFCLVGYPEFLDLSLKHNFSFSPAWSDDSFNSVSYKDPVWADQNFKDDWSVYWTLGQTTGSSGFFVSNNTLTIYANFTGFNQAQNWGARGIMLQKKVVEFNTILDPLLVIQHKESSADSSLMFSFGVTSANGTWYDGGWHHTSSSWTYSTFDLRQTFNGTVKSISIRLTDDFNPNYEGGIQNASIQLIGIYAESPILENRSE